MRKRTTQNPDGEVRNSTAMDVPS